MSKIEWTDTTWSPVTGCTKISPGCKHCYAEVMAKRCKAMGLDKYANAFELTLHPSVLGEPLKWKKPRMCFVCSMSDLFHKDVPNEFIAAVFGVMAACPSTTFQVLTKRAERLPDWFQWASYRAPHSPYSDGPQDTMVTYARDMLRNKTHIAYTGATWPLGNVWIGVSVENRKHGLPRIEHLRRTPAAVRFLSMEPLIEDLGDDWSLDGIDWVIVGGESGHGARPMHPAWVRRIRDKVLAARSQCATCKGDGKVTDREDRQLGKPLTLWLGECPVCQGRGWHGPALFFKQWGAWAPIDQAWEQDSPRPLAKNERWLNIDGGSGFHGEQVWRMRNVGKGKSGRELDGRTWDEMPAVPR